MTQQMRMFPAFDGPETKKDFQSKSPGPKVRGAIFTRPEVVHFILDLVDYSTDRPLHECRLLEPAAGEGDFLLPAVERLFSAYQAHVAPDSRRIEDLLDAIRAVEIHPGTIRNTRRRLLRFFRKIGVAEPDAERLLKAWLVEGDFLLTDLPTPFTHVVGNPPYIRQESIPEDLMAEYRARYRTIYDRADLYVPFLDRGLSILAPDGVLGFICADRWTKNRYGGPLRAMIAKNFHLAGYVDMTDTIAFRSEVSAYPAIIVIKRKKPGITRVIYGPKLDPTHFSRLAREMRSETVRPESGIVEMANVARDGEPWILDSVDRLRVVRRLEADFPALEATGCRVGIGVATGADKVFIGPMDALDVERDRKLPLLKTRDIAGGTVDWRGLGVINPFEANGALVNLEAYPKLARYLNRHAKVVRNRNCAKKNPKSWYRTIDRINPELTHCPKLLIPDIKGKAHVVYEEGRFYPHHNLYFITSAKWELKALQAVLRSGIAKLFVSAYSTRMRGGYLRYQAQYLRRIRLPRWEDVSPAARKALSSSINSGDQVACAKAVFDIYGLSVAERAIVGNEV